jgi:hypothetical protein
MSSSSEDDLIYYYAGLEYDIKKEISMYVSGLVHIDKYMKIFAKIQEIPHLIAECKRLKMDAGYWRHMEIAHSKFINDLHL